jgi:homogentisate 1,2-dioxygenase
MSWKELDYISGFGASVESEALTGALPIGQNNPQICPYGLYAEQLSGTAFTAPRLKNERTWLYRIRPSVHTGKQVEVKSDGLVPTENMVITPNQLRWSPLTGSSSGLVGGENPPVDFSSGITSMCGSGEPSLHHGLAIHMYFANANMDNKAMQNADGDFLIVPQTGTLLIKTEMGKLRVEPCEIVVIQRGIKFSVSIEELGEATEDASGYILEIFKGHFELPNLGPIGANGLANPRDFYMPVAAYEDIDGPDVKYKVVNKYMGRFFEMELQHSPFDVVAWHGNYAPYKYDLRRFNTMNSVSFDHPDPSIYTVLTCPTDEPGTAAADFVIFPPRFVVMDHSFRPPYYHRNCMTEFMGMINGSYDAKVGFEPGGASLHSCMSAHGPDAATFKKASVMELGPEYFDGGLAFMFETCFQLRVNPWALDHATNDKDYQQCWEGLPKVFTGEVIHIEDSHTKLKTPAHWVPG